MTIAPALLTPTLSNVGVSKVYDAGTGTAMTPSYTFVGLVEGDTAADLRNAGLLYNSKDVQLASKVTVRGLEINTVAGSRQSVASDYVLDASTKEVAAAITPKVVGLLASKTYDGTNSLTGAVTIATGIVGETLSYTAATASDAHVATPGKFVAAITLGDVAATGGLASNYQLPVLDAANAPVTIQAAPVTSSAQILGDFDRIYDNTVKVDAKKVNLAGSIGNALNGDRLELDFSPVELTYLSQQVGMTQIQAIGKAKLVVTTSAFSSLPSDYAFDAPVIGNEDARIKSAFTLPSVPTLIAGLSATSVVAAAPVSSSGFVRNVSPAVLNVPLTSAEVVPVLSSAKLPPTKLVAELADIQRLPVNSSITSVAGFSNVSALVPMAIQTAASFVISIKASTFEATVPGSAQVVTATTRDGGALPAWLSFNPQTLEIEGVAPSGLSQLVIKVNSRLQTGSVASTELILNFEK